MLRAFAAHVYHAIAEGTPSFAYYRYAAAFKRLQFAVARGHNVVRDAGEKRAPVHAAARLNGLYNRHYARIVAGVGYNYVKVGYVVVSFAQEGYRRLLVNGQNVLGIGVGVAQANLLNMEITDFQLQCCSLLSCSHTWCKWGLCHA